MAARKKGKDKVKVRWNAGCTAIPSQIIRNTKLSRNARLLWCLLATFQGNDESAWPNQDTLCDLLGEEERAGDISRRSIHRWTSELWFAGWLTITRTAYGHEYELHEPEFDTIKTRSLQKSPFDEVERSDTGVTSDGTRESHSSDTGVTSHGIEESHASIDQDSCTTTHRPTTPIPTPNNNATIAAAASGGGGSATQGETSTEFFLRETLGSESAKARRSVAHLPVDVVRARWERWRTENPKAGVGAFIKGLRESPPTEREITARDRRPPPLVIPNWTTLTQEEQQAAWHEYDRGNPTARNRGV